MARDRQRSKQRQAQRREARTAERRASTEPQPSRTRDALGRDVTGDEPTVRDALGRELDEPAAPRDGGAGAPPENVGRSDTVADSSPPAPIVDGVLEGDELDEDDTAIDSEEFAAATAEVAAEEERA